MASHARYLKLALKPGWYLTLSYRQSQPKKKHWFFRWTFIFLLSATGVLISWQVLCFHVYVVTGNPSFKSSTCCGERIYCHPNMNYIYIYICVCVCVCVCVLIERDREWETETEKVLKDHLRKGTYRLKPNWSLDEAAYFHFNSRQ